MLLLSLLLAVTPAHAVRRISDNGPDYFPAFSQGSVQSVSFTGTAGAVNIAASLGRANEIVRIFTTSKAYIAVGSGVTATAASMPIPAETEVTVEVPSGHRISAVSRGASGSGDLFVTHLEFLP